MKRIVVLFLLCALALTGCGLSQEGSRFYYPRTEYLYNDPEPVVTWEHRDTAGHSQDLRYILSQYMMGPLDQKLQFPLPRGTRMTALDIVGTDVTVSVSEEAEVLSDARFSLAAACLGLTVMDTLKDDAALTLVCGERSVTVTRENLLMYEEPFPRETEAS